jgi:hypothetical protein
MKNSSAMRISLTGVAALAACGWTNLAVGAQAPVSSQIEVAAIERFELPALAEVRRIPFDSRPVAAAPGCQVARGDGVFNHNKLKGVVADNSASNLTTGMNVISEGAFAGSSGLPTVIQNSGNNVLIQNSTIVNVQVK